MRYFLSFWFAGFLVILYYDYFLTLPQEVQFLWPPHNEQGWFTLACLLNRYIPMIGVIPVVISYFFPVNSSVSPSSLTFQIDASESPYRTIAVSYQSVLIVTPAINPTVLGARVCTHTVNGLWYPYKHTLVVRPNNDLTNSLAYDIHHGSPLPTPRLRAVWPKSLHSGASPFSRYGVVCYCIRRSFHSELKAWRIHVPTLLLLSVKVSLFLDREAGDETIPVISPFGGCAQYTPYAGYVPDPACDLSSSMIRLITLVIEVDVCHRVTDHLFTITSRNYCSLCYRMGRRICLRQRDILPHTVQSIHDRERHKTARRDCP